MQDVPRSSQVGWFPRGGWSRLYLLPMAWLFATVILYHIGVSKNRGTLKWMVYNGKPENPIKMDDLGVPLFLEISIYIDIIC